MENSKISFRFAEQRDVPLVMEFIKGLASYENLLHEVTSTNEQIEEWLFEKEQGEVFFLMEDEREVGFALYYNIFSTFSGRSGIFIEDLFVVPEYRKKGYGKAILVHLAQIAKERELGRIDWMCLDRNQPSIDFYLSIGATPVNQWSTYRLDADGIKNLAEK